MAYATAEYARKLDVVRKYRLAVMNVGCLIGMILGLFALVIESNVWVYVGVLGLQLGRTVWRIWKYVTTT